MIKTEVYNERDGLNAMSLPFPKSPLFSEDWDDAGKKIQEMERPLVLDLGRVDGYVRITVDYMGHPKGFFNPAAGSEFKEPPLESRIAIVRIQEDSGEDGDESPFV